MAFFPQFSDNIDQSVVDDPTLQAINLKRKLALADSLRNTPMPQGQMIGNRYVAPSWTQYLAGAVDRGMANVEEQKAIKEYANAQKEQQIKLGKAVEQFGKEISPEEIKTLQDNFVSQPLQEGQNVPTSPFTTNEQVGQIAPNYAGQSPVMNMTGNTTVNQPIESVSYRPRTLTEKMQAVTNFGQRTNNQDLMNKIVLGQAENIFKAPESLIDKPSPKDFTGASLAKYAVSHDWNDLQTINKPETAGSLEKDYTFAKSQGYKGSIEDFKRVATDYINPYQQAKLDMQKRGLFTPDTIEMLADQGLAGDKSVFTGLGRGTQGAENIAAVREVMNRKMKERNWSGSDIAAQNAEFNAFVSAERTAGVKGANIELAGNEFNNIVPIAQKASVQVSRSGFLPFGKAQIMFDEQTNNPALSSFAAANNGLVNTYARAISPTGVPTVEDKRHARKILSEAKDQEAYNAAVTTLQQEINAAKKAPSEVRANLRSTISPSGGSAGKVIHWNDLPK